MAIKSRRFLWRSVTESSDAVSNGSTLHEGGVRRYWRSVVRILVFCGLAPAFPQGLGAAAAPQRVVFTSGGLNERSGILWVARDAGIFHKHGIEPTIVNVRNAQVGISALAGGESHFHVGSATGTSIGAMAGGLDLAYIAGLINKLDGVFMVNPAIRTSADLKGKRIGVQSIGGGLWMFSMLAFEHWGINPERDNIQFRVIGDQSV
ncbi:MAG: hypothetical protein FJ143_15480, partial [Deltaproteobacteria bacterium]|nr:hypothetical protein [Deltaproteobacteria bacterium]